MLERVRSIVLHSGPSRVAARDSVWVWGRTDSCPFSALHRHVPPAPSPAPAARCFKLWAAGQHSGPRQGHLPLTLLEASAGAARRPHLCAAASFETVTWD